MDKEKDAELFTMRNLGGIKVVMLYVILQQLMQCDSMFVTQFTCNATSGILHPAQEDHSTGNHEEQEPD